MRYERLLLYLLFCLFVVLGSCSAQRTISQGSLPSDGASGLDQEKLLGGSVPEIRAYEERKIMQEVSMRLIVKNPDTIGAHFEVLAQKYEGYLESFGTDQAVLRIKPQYLDEAVEKLGQLGKIKNQVRRGQDVTEAFFDLNIRLENAEKLRVRYLEILDKAHTVDEILKIEKELERINTRIDLLKGKKRLMQNQIALASIQIQIQEKVKPGPLAYVFVGAYKAVSWLFVRK